MNKEYAPEDGHEVIAINDRQTLVGVYHEDGFTTWLEWYTATGYACAFYFDRVDDWTFTKI